jgi:ABC-type antimicrobial peptide transport system permease subunit
LTSQLIAALGALALVLASVGVYGSLSSLVNARTREIAVRMALGASPGRLLRRTVLQGLWPVLAGAVAGMAAAMAIISAVRSLLFGIEGIDVASLSIGFFIVLPVTALACLAPAIRAARTDPIAVLRAD